MLRSEVISEGISNVCRAGWAGKEAGEDSGAGGIRGKINI
jgi:hypothetical protein